MPAALSPERLRRLRLAAQRLSPATAAASPIEATASVCGIQAQDVRAAGLALRSRVPGLERTAVDSASDLLRTWTVRGTAHLIAAADHAWMRALTAARNERYFSRLIAKRGALDAARAALPAMVAMLEVDGPLSRADLLGGVADRGLPSLGPRAINVLMPWACTCGPIIGLPDGRFRAADPPAPVGEDEALGVLGRRYLAGYGPAAEADLAKWSGLPLSRCRRAFEAAGELERAGELLAMPGTLDEPPPEPPPVALLAAFDTAMLGWSSREPLVGARDAVRVAPGGGIVRAVALARGRAVATWRVEGGGRRRTLGLERFGRAPARAALAAEAADVGRFLGIELRLST